MNKSNEQHFFGRTLNLKKKKKTGRFFQKEESVLDGIWRNAGNDGFFEGNKTIKTGWPWWCGVWVFEITCSREKPFFFVCFGKVQPVKKMNEEENKTVRDLNKEHSPQDCYN